MNVFVAIATAPFRRLPYGSSTLMEDAMTDTDKLMHCAKPVVLARHLDDASGLYVLMASLLAILVGLPAVWYFATAANATATLIA
jgi:hypothetical protein